MQEDVFTVPPGKLNPLTVCPVESCVKMKLMIVPPGTALADCSTIEVMFCVTNTRKLYVPSTFAVTTPLEIARFFWA